MNFNPKGLLFWVAMFGAAGCVALERPYGTLAYVVVGVAVLVFG